MPTKNLTVRFIDRIEASSSGRVEYWDEGTPGFGLRVSESGRKTWVVMYRHLGKVRRLTLGTYPTLPLADAREQAKDALRAAAKGKDPAGEKKAARLGDTFGDLAEDYIELYAKPNKRSWKEDRRALDRDLLPKFKNRKAADIKRREVIALLDRIKARGAAVLANRTLEIMRGIYNWGIDKERVEHNPCTGVKPSEETSRDRVLSDDEIRKVWATLAAQPLIISGRFRLQLITAQRPGEVRKMRWSDVDDDTGWWTIPAEITKNRLSHRVWLTAPALAVLNEMQEQSGHAGWAFPSPSADGPVRSNTKPTAAICKASGVSFTPHDLRRTAASHMASLGISRFTIGRVLNHVEKSVTATYDRHSYDAEKRAALEAWAQRMGEIIAGKKQGDGKVVTLRPAAS
jgi:integrase